MSRGATQFEEYQLDRMNELPIPSDEDLDVENIELRSRNYSVSAIFKVEKELYSEARLYAERGIRCFFPDAEEVPESPSVVELGTEYLNRLGDRDITKERLIRDALGILASTLLVIKELSLVKGLSHSLILFSILLSLLLLASRLAVFVFR